jgi:hypothetical protein
MPCCCFPLVAAVAAAAAGLVFCLQNLRKLIDDCWAADPEARPSFEDVVNRLEDMLKDMPKHSPYSKGNDGCQCSLQ